MLFKPNHIELIKQGVKTETRRRWKRPNVRVGRFYPVMRDYGHKHRPRDGYIKVMLLFQQELRRMSEANAYCEGGYTLAEYREVWKEINRYWNPSEKVWVVDFKWVRKKPKVKR